MRNRWGLFALLLPLFLFSSNSDASPPCRDFHRWGGAVFDGPTSVSVIIPSTEGITWHRQNGTAPASVVGTFPIVPEATAAEGGPRHWAHIDSAIAYFWTAGQLFELEASGSRTLVSDANGGVEAAAAHFSSGAWTIAVVHAANASHGRTLRLLRRSLTQRDPAELGSYEFPGSEPSFLRPLHMQMVPEGNGVVVHIENSLVVWNGTTFRAEQLRPFLPSLSGLPLLLGGSAPNSARFYVVDEPMRRLRKLTHQSDGSWSASSVSFPNEIASIDHLHNVNEALVVSTSSNNPTTRSLVSLNETSTGLSVSQQLPLDSWEQIWSVGTGPRIAFIARSGPGLGLWVLGADGVTTSFTNLGPVAKLDGSSGACSCGCKTPGHRTQPSALWVGVLALLLTRRRSSHS